MTIINTTDETIGVGESDPIPLKDPARPSTQSRVVGGLCLLSLLGGAVVGHFVAKEDAAAVVTATARADEYSIESMYVVTSNAKVQGTMIDNITRFDAIDFDAAQRRITYRHSIIDAEAFPDIDLFRERGAQLVKKDRCPSQLQFLKHNYRVTYTYAMPDGRVVDFDLACSS